MDYAYVVLKPLIGFFLRMCEIEFTFAGVTVSVGALIIAGLIAGVLFAFLRRLA